MGSLPRINFRGLWIGLCVSFLEPNYSPPFILIIVNSNWAAEETETQTRSRYLITHTQISSYKYHHANILRQWESLYNTGHLLGGFPPFISFHLLWHTELCWEGDSHPPVSAHASKLLFTFLPFPSPPSAHSQQLGWLPSAHLIPTLHWFLEPRRKQWQELMYYWHWAGSCL